MKKFQIEWASGEIETVQADGFQPQGPAVVFFKTPTITSPSQPPVAEIVLLANFEHVKSVRPMTTPRGLSVMEA